LDLVFVQLYDGVPDKWLKLHNLTIVLALAPCAFVLSSSFFFKLFKSC
jgi:hypothetical protein